MAILARTWRRLREVERALLEEGIPYRFESGAAQGLLAGIAVQDVLRGTLAVASGRPVGAGDPLAGAAGWLMGGPPEPAAQELFWRVARAQGVADDPEVEAVGRKIAAHDLARFTAAFGHLAGDGANARAVVLSTVHSQKGQEFPTVILVGAEAGTIPNRRRDDHLALVARWRRFVREHSRTSWAGPVTVAEEIEDVAREERRIFFVAITRAEWNLVITHVGAPSPYLDDFVDADVTAVPGPAAIAMAQAPERVSGYMAEHRRFRTKSGDLVRSKSEHILADAFFDAGLYFEYEEPIEPGVALPDFVFPDQNVVLEHLGLMEDPDYVARWERKAEAYAELGYRCLTTLEHEVLDPAALIRRLLEEMDGHLPAEAATAAGRLRKFRAETGLWVGPVVPGAGRRAQAATVDG